MCTIIATTMAVVGTTCSVILAYNMSHATKEIRRVADNLENKVKAAESHLT